MTTTEAITKAIAAIQEAIASDFDRTQLHSRTVADLLHEEIDRASAANRIRHGHRLTEDQAIRRENYATATISMARTLLGVDDRGRLALSLKTDLADITEKAGQTPYLNACGEGNPNWQGAAPCGRQWGHRGDHQSSLSLPEKLRFWPRTEQAEATV